MNRRVRTTKTTATTRWVLLAAVAAVPVAGFGTPAGAQHRVDRSNTQDANNRIGSGGENSTGPQRLRPGQFGNNIVTGNVTADKHFRGNVDYTDPRAFRGTTANEQSDFLIRRSAGTADARIADRVYTNAPREFYGDSRAVPPPADYVGQGYSAYQGSGQESRAAYDTGQRIEASLREQASLPRPGELVLPGPVTSEAPSLISGSPLFGIRTWTPEQAADQYYLQGGDVGVPRQPTSPRLDDRTIQQMRQELFGEPAADGDVLGQRTGAGGGAGAGASTPETTSVLAPPGVASGAALPPGQPLSSDANQQPLAQNLAGTPLTSDLSTQQGTRQRLVLPQQTLRSNQVAEMRRRLEEQNADRGVSDQEAHRAFREARRTAEAAQGDQQQPAQPGGTAQQQPTQPPQPDEAAPGAPGATPGTVPPAGQQPGDGANVRPQTPAERLGLTDYAKQNERLMRDPSAAGGDAAAGPAKKPTPVKVRPLRPASPARAPAT